MSKEVNSSSSSPTVSNPCSICLQPINQEAYLDRCFHKFCYNCIARWSKWVASQNSISHSSLQCPLCKRENFSIIYGFDGDSFQRHYVNQDPESGFSFSEGHRYRLQCYYHDTGDMHHRFNVQQYWNCRKYLQPNKWLQSWLRREIQALIQEEDVDIIVHHIIGVVESILRSNEKEHFKGTCEQKQEEFRVLVSDAAGCFLFGRTKHFVNELELFLASGLTIEAYDNVYLQHLGFDTTGEASGHTEGKDDQLPQIMCMSIFDEDTNMSD